MILTHQPDRSPASPAVVAVTELAVICDACAKPISDGAGYLHVSHHAIAEHEQAMARWREDNQPGGYMCITDLLAIPKPARWRAHHRRCDPEPDSSDYWIDVARLRTWRALLEWTAHLMGKRWLPATDWQRLIESAVYGNGRIRARAKGGGRL